MGIGGVCNIICGLKSGGEEVLRLERKLHLLVAVRWEKSKKRLFSRLSSSIGLQNRRV